MHAHRRLPDVPTSRTSRNIPMRVVRCRRPRCTKVYAGSSLISRHSPAKTGLCDGAPLRSS